MLTTLPAPARRIAAVLTLVALGTAGCAAPPDAEPVSPDVVLITLDTTRADRLGAYGSAAGLTPHLDALAERSVVFELALAQASTTPVSHASILTGLDPYHHGLRVLHGRTHNRLHDDVPTLAEALRSHGYATAAFVSAFPAGSSFGLDQGFDLFDEEFHQAPGPSTVGPRGTVNTGKAQRRADATIDRALAWLREARLGNPRPPFFTWVHCFDPHDPQLLPPGEERPAAEMWESREYQRVLYDREVAFVDAQLGRLLDAVAAGERPTVVVVTADHGQGLGDHDWWTHGLLYQEQIHVPLILGLPEAAAAGRRVASLVRTTDIAPTIFDLAGLGAERRPETDGASLLPLVSGDPERQRTAYADSLNELVYSFTAEIRDAKEDILFARLDPPWKYIHHYRNPPESELYHLADDPGERANLLREHPEVARRFQLELRGLDVLPRPDARETPLSEEERERLRALGYLD